jgi:hypothetical protein
MPQFFIGGTQSPGRTSILSENQLKSSRNEIADSEIV